LHFCFVKCMGENYIGGEGWRCSGSFLTWISVCAGRWIPFGLSFVVVFLMIRLFGRFFLLLPLTTCICFLILHPVYPICIFVSCESYVWVYSFIQRVLMYQYEMEKDYIVCVL
jgi:hypothetical protein